MRSAANLHYQFACEWRYARVEGYDISDTESRGTSGSLKDFIGDSSSMDRSGQNNNTYISHFISQSLNCQYDESDAWSYIAGRFDVMIERPYDDDKEVRDIDSRLHALKNFLRTAKARTAQK